MADYVNEQCGECGITFGFPKAVRDTRLQDLKTWYCPNGHPRVFNAGHTEADKLRRERDRLKQSVAYQLDCTRRAEEEAEHQKRRANGYKGHAARITKRAKAGVCPCCNRTFAQLARHMATQHPTFTPDAPEPPKLALVSG